MSFVDTLLGRRLASSEEGDQKIGALAGIPALGLDGLSSAAYGPEAALTILIPLGAVGLRYINPVTGLIVLLLLILYFSYRQTITAYPTGGGSYTVASKNLGTNFGLLAAAALMLDYTLNVAVGISAGVEAIISTLPSLHRYTLTLCLLGLFVITVVNLRGTREAGATFAIPTYVYIGTLLFMIGAGLVRALQSGGHPHAIVPPPTLPTAEGAAGFWLLLRAFASGCTAMTGVEAVSNGVTIFAKPTVKNAQLTLTVIVAVLAVLLAGVAYLARVYNIAAMDENNPSYQSVISLLLQATVGRGALYYITQASVLAVLVLSANTSYTGFPRLCRLVAMDGYLPRAFALLGRRLVYTVGIVFLTGLSGALLIAFDGITDRLIPLFAIGAFLAFTLSQAGMVEHWRKIGQSQEKGRSAVSRGALFINALGAVSTGVALIVILVAKFTAGAWITVLLIPALVMLFAAIKRSYNAFNTAIKQTHELDVSHNEAPVVVVPIESWNIMTERALRFGIRLSPDVIAVHVRVPGIIHDDHGDQRADELQEVWSKKVEPMFRSDKQSAPRLEMLDSPYRQIFRPLTAYLQTVKEEYPDRLISVVIPELVETHWFDWLLHNHQATALKAGLLFLADPRIVVINIPWYHSRAGAPPVLLQSESVIPRPGAGR